MRFSIKPVVVVIWSFYFLINYPVVNAFEFSLFGSAKYTNGDDENENFALGELELITEHSLSDKTHIVADLIFKSEFNGLEVELERMSINRSITDMLTIGIGRFMQPMGFWNHNFSHGSLAQHSITRPFILELENDENMIIPTHAVGVLFRGESIRFSYQLALANASGTNTTAPATTTGPATAHSLNNETPNNELSVFLRLTYRLTQRLELGMLAGNHNYAELDEGTGLVDKGEILFKQNFLALDFNYNGSSFYLFSEYYNLNYEDNSDLSGGLFTANPDSYNGQFFYVQIGYRVTDKLTLFSRYESLDIDDNATFFAIQDIVSQKHSIAGFNYAIEPSNSIRIQITEIDPEIGSGDTITQLQWYYYLL